MHAMVLYSVMLNMSEIEIFKFVLIGLGILLLFKFQSSARYNPTSTHQGKTESSKCLHNLLYGITFSMQQTTLYQPIFLEQLKYKMGIWHTGMLNLSEREM
jgi:hypothetical protein